MRSLGLFSLSIVFFSVKGSAAETEVRLRPSLQWYTFGSYQTVSESKANSENAALKLEDRMAVIDLRPSLKLDIDRFQMIARPQLRSEISSAKVAGKRIAEHPHSSSEWIEAYGAYTASDEVLLTYGIQNYQWGAAESLNPSNRIFHETVDSKGLLYSVQARNIVRLNYSWTKSVNTVIMAETQPVKDAPIFQAEEVFQSKSLMKNEVSWSDGLNYAGFVIGAAETDGPWVGEYFNQELIPGLTMYADASHERGSNAWYPIEEASNLPSDFRVISFAQNKAADEHVYSLAVGGLRYSFEGGSDLRFEYIHNSAGWSKDENTLAKRAIDSQRPVQLTDYKTHVGRWYKPGLEFRGQRYGLCSLRLPDFFEIKDLTIYLRGLRSFQDHSASYYASVEYGFGLSSTLLLSSYVAKGNPDDELRGAIASSSLIGLRQDF